MEVRERVCAPVVAFAAGPSSANGSPGIRTTPSGGCTASAVLTPYDDGTGG